MSIVYGLFQRTRTREAHLEQLSDEELEMGGCLSAATGRSAERDPGLAPGS